MVGQRIKECRKAKHMTQAELAERANISRMTLVKIEKGTVPNMSAYTLRSLALVLGVSTDYLLCVEC